MGAESLITVDAGGQTVQARMAASTVHRLGVHVGAAMTVSYPEDHVYLFDGSTGVTLHQAGFSKALRRAA